LDVRIIKQNAVWGVGVLFFVLTSYIVFVGGRSWGFIDDDFGDAVRMRESSMAQVSDYATGKRLLIDSVRTPRQSAAAGQYSAFTVFYRPLWILLGLVQSSLGLITPSAALHINWFMHLLLALLLFALLRRWNISLVNSLLSTGWFLFHPSLGLWFGRLSTEQYHVEVGLLLATLFTWSCAERSRSLSHSRWLSGISVALYVAALGIRETVIVLPVFILLASLVDDLLDGMGLSFASLKKALKKTSWYWFAALGYMLVRVYFFGLGVGGNSLDIAKFIASIPIKTLCYAADTAGAGMVLRGMRLAKLALIGFFLGLGVVACRSCDKETLRRVGLAWIFGLLFSWPVFIWTHFPSYSYGALLGYSVLVALGLTSIESFATRLYHTTALVLMAIVFAGALHLNVMLNDRSQTMGMVGTEYQKLAWDLGEDESVVIGAAPRTGFAFCGSYQAILWYRPEFKGMLYFDAICSYFDKNFSNDVVRMFESDGLLVHPRQTGYAIEFTKPNAAWIPAFVSNQFIGTAGTYDVVERAENGNVVKLDAQLNESLYKEPCALYFWDSSAGTFYRSKHRA
jgi:hypothetical protein